MAKDFLDTVDTDGDGKISKEELFNYYKKDWYNVALLY
jgi:Ca2+-binding EF-hand superfamily protein